MHSRTRKNKKIQKEIIMDCRKKKKNLKKALMSEKQDFKLLKIISARPSCFTT